jgi:hypothetical protein
VVRRSGTELMTCLDVARARPAERSEARTTKKFSRDGSTGAARRNETSVDLIDLVIA